MVRRPNRRDKRDKPARSEELEYLRGQSDQLLMPKQRRAHLLRFILTGLVVTGLSAGLRADDLEPVRKWIKQQAGMKTAIVEFAQERRLRTLKEPIVKEGTFWYQAPSSFRWQVGSPPQIVAVQKGKGDLFVVDEEKKTIDQYPYEIVLEKGNSNGLSFLEAGFPRDLAEFQKNFKIRSVKELEDFTEVQTTLTDRRASLGCRKVVFFLDAKTSELRHVHLYFRDGSTVTNRFKSMKVNPSIPAKTFMVGTDGYKVELKRG